VGGDGGESGGLWKWGDAKREKRGRKRKGEKKNRWRETEKGERRINREEGRERRW